MKNVVLGFHLMFFLPLISTSAISQTFDPSLNTPKLTYWLTTSFGEGNFKRGPGTSSPGDIKATTVSASAAWHHHLLSLRYSYNKEFRKNRWPDEYERDFGLLYGIRLKKLGFIWVVSAGCAWTKGLTYRQSVFETPARQNLVRVGLPVEAHLMWNPVDHLAVGVTGTANINKQRSFHSFGLSLAFGVL